MTIHEAVIEEIKRRIEVIGKNKLPRWRVFKRAKYSEAIRNYKNLLKAQGKDPFPDNRIYNPAEHKDQMDLLSSPSTFDS
jgi:hypothetical protein